MAYWIFGKGFLKEPQVRRTTISNKAAAQSLFILLQKNTSNLVQK